MLCNVQCNDRDHHFTTTTTLYSSYQHRQVCHIDLNKAKIYHYFLAITMVYHKNVFPNLEVF